jgi:hypothetical protein
MEITRQTPSAMYFYCTKSKKSTSVVGAYDDILHVYRQLFANFMVVTMTLFAHTTFFLAHMLSDMFHTNH